MDLSEKAWEIALLRLLQVKGVSLLSQMPAAVGRIGEPLVGRLEQLKESGLVDAIPRGYRLTESGQAIVNGAMSAERAQLSDADCTTLHEDFGELNAAFKRLVYDWQVVGDTQQPSTHQDAAYDSAIRQRLAALHPETLAIVARAESLIPRLGLLQR